MDKKPRKIKFNPFKVVKDCKTETKLKNWLGKDDTSLANLESVRNMYLAAKHYDFAELVFKQMKVAAVNEKNASADK